MEVSNSQNNYQKRDSKNYPLVTISVGQGIPDRLLPSRACFRLLDKQIYVHILYKVYGHKNKESGLYILMLALFNCEKKGTF